VFKQKTISNVLVAAAIFGLLSVALLIGKKFETKI
jgi:hypothetical protein